MNSILLNFSAAGLAEGYYKLGEMEKANDIALKLMDVYSQEMSYYLTLDRYEVARLGNEPDIAMSVLQKLLLLARVHKQDDVLNQLEERFEEIETRYMNSPLARG